MIKISVDELDSLLKPAETMQEVNPQQTGENSTKPPALRKPIDALVSGVKTVGAGAVGLGAALKNIKTNLPLKEIEQ